MYRCIHCDIVVGIKAFFLFIITPTHTLMETNCILR